MKKFAAAIYLADGKAVKNRGGRSVISEDPAALALQYSNQGADEILVYDLSDGDAEHEAAIGWLKKIVAAAEVPVIGCGNIRRFEDVKKILYTGAAKAALNLGDPGEEDHPAGIHRQPDPVRRRHGPLQWSRPGGGGKGDTAAPYGTHAGCHAGTDRGAAGPGGHRGGLRAGGECQYGGAERHQGFLRGKRTGGGRLQREAGFWGAYGKCRRADSRSGTGL